jgi:hypothetical protein
MVQRLRLFYLIILIFLFMYFIKSSKKQFQINRLVDFYGSHLTAFPYVKSEFIVREYFDREDRVSLQVQIVLDKLPTHVSTKFRKFIITCNFDRTGNHLETSVQGFKYLASYDRNGDVWGVDYDNLKKFYINTRMLVYIPFSAFSWPGGFGVNPVEILTYFARNYWGYNE